MASKPERDVKISENCEASMQRYLAAGHAIQSGVRFEQESMGSQSGTPKHLRTGLDLRAADHAALVFLLIEKGVFTHDEYAAAIADEAEREVGRYERRIKEYMSQKTGNPSSNITLG